MTKIQGKKEMKINEIKDSHCVTQMLWEEKHSKVASSNTIVR